ncbi:NAD-P-binding protein [Mycena filopes]|nr:NAD-P-binding protein [Mycena filopes]
MMICTVYTVLLVGLLFPVRISGCVDPHQSSFQLRPPACFPPPMSLPTFTVSTTAEDVATVFAKQIRGKNVLITGTSMNGLGFEDARVLAKHANLVIITGYNAERLKLSEAAIKKETPNANVRPLLVDLSSLSAVRKAAAEVNAYSEPLHVVIHNAAAAIGPFKLTPDNLESQLATAHFGPFLLTKLILPKILAAGTNSYTPRVVFLSSSAHALGSGVDLDTIAHPDPWKYTPFGAYSESKTATILDAIELSKRSRGRINAYSVSPGAVYTNYNQKEESKADMIAFGILTPDGLPNTAALPWKSIPEGAATTLIAAFDPRLDAGPGAYLRDSVVANEKLAPHITSDPETAARLWEVTEKIVGEEFTF